MSDNFKFHIDRFSNSNRMTGIIRDLTEAINEEDDPEILRRLGTSLKDIGGTALNKRFEINKK